MRPPGNSARVRESRARLRLRAGWIAAGYAVFATLWIYFSDQALERLLGDPERYARWGIYKGFAFVAVTAFLLLLLMRRAVGATEDSFATLRAHKAALERVQRLYAALSQINQAIVRMPARADLLQRVCEVLVEQGGFRMVWIGWADRETQRLPCVAKFGDDSRYVETIDIYIDERPEGLGPSGRAFRAGEPYVCNDLLGDPTTLPWRSVLATRSFRSSAVFPIRVKGRVEGLLNVYADERGFFQDQEFALLAGAANDLSFALDNLLREEERRQAELIAHSEKLFSDAMIESMPGVFYFYDEQGRFLRWNRNFETVSGYTREEIAGMSPLEYFPPADRARLQEKITEVFAQGESFIEAPFLAKEGTVTPYFFTGRRVVFDGRHCLVGVGLDITERKRGEEALQRSEQRYRSTLDGILEGCQLIGFDWRYLYLNDAAAIHNRRPNAELLGRTMPEMWPGIEQSSLFALLRRCMDERAPFHEETEFVFVDGSRGWFDVRAQPVPEGIFVLSIDISERKQAEHLLRELNENLEHKVAARTDELQAALVRAEAADRIKSAFLATMSHELRTPLNSIIGFTGIVLQGLAGPLNAEQTKQLGMVRGSARHLLELINDVLDISKIEAGQLEVRSEPFDLAASIERAVASVRPLAERKGLSLLAEIPAGLGEMVGDRRRFEQILLNLLNNGLKFTDRGSVSLAVDTGVTLPTMAEHGDQPAVRIDIIDTGIGIKPEHLQTLFQPFRQVDSGLARQHDGTGLGLVICRRLAALMGGDILVTSEWQKGSTFTVLLPRCSQKTPP